MPPGSAGGAPLARPVAAAVKGGDHMWKKITGSKIFKAGAVLFGVGITPLLLYVLFEAVTGKTGGNPVGLGLLFFVTFWPAVIMMIAGAVSALLRKDKAREP